MFARDAVPLIHEASVGMLRAIDRICQDILEAAADQGRTLIDRELVTDALDVESLHSSGSES